MTEHREPPPGAAPGETWPDEDRPDRDWPRGDGPPRDVPREHDRESGQHLIWVLIAAAIMILVGWW